MILTMMVNNDGDEYVGGGDYDNNDDNDGDNDHDHDHDHDHDDSTMIMMIMITQRGARRFPISSSRLTQGGDFDFILHTM